MSTQPATAPQGDFAVTLRIVSVVVYTFLCYLTIGIPLAVLPGFVHTELGYGSVMAGAAISVQYFATYCRGRSPVVQPIPPAPSKPCSTVSWPARSAAQCSLPPRSRRSGMR
jgi:hypothetical protein